MSAVWSELRKSRIQVGLEAVLLKAFNSPGQTLERRIIQSKEFRSKVVTAFAEYSLKHRKAFTESNFSELARSKVCTDYLSRFASSSDTS
jgi:hypothetical protein